MTVKSLSAKKLTAAPATVDHSKSSKVIGEALKKGVLIVPKIVEVPAPKGKSVRKGSTAPVADTPKTATKPEKKVAAFVARTVKAGTPVHAISEDARPVSGRNLFAHTHAALTLLGLLDAKLPAVPQKHVLTIMGQRAVTYHTKERNFEAAPDHGLRLTIHGYNWFAGRMAEGKVNTDLANAFMTLFVEGKAAQATGVAQSKVYQTML